MSESSKQSTVRSRASTRSRSSSRRPDPKLEEEKVRAQLKLLYLEKQEAETELEQIRNEIKQKEQLSLNSSMESSARLEALEISARVIYFKIAI